MNRRFVYFAVSCLALTGTSFAQAQEQKALPTGATVMINPGPSAGASGLGLGVAGRDPGPLEAKAKVTLPSGVVIELEGKNCETDGNTVGCSD